MVDLNNSGIEGAAAKPVLDAACMAELRALDPDGKAQLVKRVLATYRTSLAKLVEQLRVARADDAWDQVSRVAHTLKSSSASIGALELARICAEIETSIRTDSLVGLPGRLDAMDRELKAVLQAVTPMLSIPGTPK